MKLEFKREDFEGKYPEYEGFKDDQLGEIVAVANKRLEEMLSAAPIVYAHDDSPPIWGTIWTLKPASQLQLRLRARARLVSIEEIS